MSDLDAREVEFEEAVAAFVASGGGRVSYQGRQYAVVVVGRRPNHVLHLLLTACTLGLWGIVWIVLGFSGGERSFTLSLDEDGELDVEPGATIR